MHKALHQNHAVVRPDAQTRLEPGLAQLQREGASGRDANT